MDVSKNDHKTLSGPLEAFSQNILRQLDILVPKPQHRHCMQRTHFLKKTSSIHPSESCPACIVGSSRVQPVR
jgi:hypothetical protein